MKKYEGVCKPEMKLNIRCHEYEKCEDCPIGEAQQEMEDIQSHAEFRISHHLPDEKTPKGIGYRGWKV